MNKKAFMITLAVLLFILMVPVRTLTDGGFSYELLEDGTACITGCSLSGDIRIPDTIDGYTVTALNDELFYDKSGIRSVYIPASVIRLGKHTYEDNTFAYVFSYCCDLQKIEVDAANPALASKAGVLYSKDYQILYNYPCNKSDSSFSIPAKTNELDCTSFASAKNLKKLYIDGYHVTWRGYTFYDDQHMTVYYHAGCSTANRVMLDYAMQQISDYGPYPTFEEYGDPMPEPDTVAGSDLGVPTNLKLSRTSNGLKLTWKAAAGAEKYHIYRQVGNGIVIGTPYAVTTETEFLDTDLPWGSMNSLVYWVKSVRGNERHESRDAYWVCFPPVENVTAECSGKGTVRLRWKACQKNPLSKDGGAGGRDQDGYEIYYTVNGNVPSFDQEALIRITDIETTEYTVKDLEPGTYSFYMRMSCRFFGEFGLVYLHEVWSKPITVTVAQDDQIVEIDGNQFELNQAKKTATFTGAVISSTKKIAIPGNIKVEGKTYKVTAIKAKACKGMNKLTTVIIGANVKNIGKAAFQDCKSLKTITVKTEKLKTSNVGDAAFKGIYKKATFKCPKAKLNAYKKLFIKKGAPKTCRFVAIKGMEKE